MTWKLIAVMTLVGLIVAALLRLFALVAWGPIGDRPETIIAASRPILQAVRQYRHDYHALSPTLEQLKPRYLAADVDCSQYAPFWDLGVVGRRNSRRHFIYYCWGEIDQSPGWYVDRDGGEGPEFLSDE